jgi:hypothetical protein
VLSALSEIGADLGDPVEVALTGGKVMVTGPADIPARRQMEIRASVAHLPHVEVEFTSSAPVSAATEMGRANGSAAGAAMSPMEGRLEKHLGGHAEFDRFSTQLQDLDDAAMQRVFALRRLAQKFPAEDEVRLSGQDLNLLHELSRKHTVALAEKIGSMEKILVPTLSSLGGTAASIPATAQNGWQPAAEGVYRRAQRVDELIAQMLGMTAGNASPSELMTALNALHANLDECQRALK